MKTQKKAQLMVLWAAVVAVQCDCDTSSIDGIMYVGDMQSESSVSASGSTSLQVTTTAATSGSGSETTQDVGDTTDGASQICGDGEPEGLEECDNGVGNNADDKVCTAECKLNVCGDGKVGPGEDCDDGNVLDGDACSPTCAALCTVHRDCPESACDFEFGVCFPAATTMWVGGFNCDDDGDGAMPTPLCGLEQAFFRIKVGIATKVAVRAKSGAYVVSGPLHVPPDRVVALMPAIEMQDDLKISIGSPTAPMLVVDPTGRLLLDGVEVDKSSGDGLECTQGSMWLDRLTVSGAAVRGITSQNCAIIMRSSVMVGNKTGGVKVVGGKLRVENSFISSNGDFEIPGGGVYLGGGASLDAVYTTFVDNISAAGSPFSVACDEDAGKETVKLRNSIAINKGLNTLCEGGSVATTAWTTFASEGSNIAVDFGSLSMYLEQDANIVGVYRAIPGTFLEALAMWQEGDPAVDFDGDERPGGNNSPDYAGADRPAN